MRGGHDGAHPGFAFGDGGKRDAGAQHSLPKQLAREFHGAGAISKDDWGNGRFAGGRGFAADVEAQEAQLFFPEAGVFPKLVDTLGLLLENIKGGNAGGRDGGWMRGRKQEGPGAVVEVIDEVARAADVAAERADGFR